MHATNLLPESFPGEIVVFLVIGIVPEDGLEVLDGRLHLLALQFLLLVSCGLCRQLELDEDQGTCRSNKYISQIRQLIW